MTMKKHLNPSEAARETLIVLASRKLAPTPENYSKVFREIDGSSDSALRTPDTPQLEPAWADLIQDLLRQLETPHKGITITRKKEGLETVLNRFSSKPDELFGKLQGLLRSWTSAPTAALDAPPPPADIAPTATAVKTANTPKIKGGDSAQAHQELILQLWYRDLRQK